MLLAAGSGAAAWLGCGDDLAGECLEPTEPNSEGPFFLAGSPERASFRGDGEAGMPLRLRGRVLDRDCLPIAGARLEFWHADDAGAYDLDGYRYRGHQIATDGRFELLTILPGHYLNGAAFRPAHIHLKVAALGGELTTQLYFEGDPYNESDSLIRSSLIMPVVREATALHCDFDLVVG